MKNILLTTIFVALSVLADARIPPSETPRATDLLTAEKRAEQAKGRLHLPAKSGGGWKQGGSGWTTPPKKRDEPRRTIRVEIHEPRGRVRED